MLKFIFWTAFFLVLGGFILHLGLNIPYITIWLGKLPGDFIIIKKGIKIYFPLVSAAIVSIIFCFLILPLLKR